MRPDERLSKVVFGRKFSAPVGLGTKLDGLGVAASAWTRFGFSFIEFGPVTSSAQQAEGLMLETKADTLRFTSQPTIAPKTLAGRLRRLPAGPVLKIVRLRMETTGTPQEAAGMLRELAEDLEPMTDFFSVEVGKGGSLPEWPEEEWGRFWRSLKSSGTGGSWLLVVPLSVVMDDLPSALKGADGVILDAFEEVDGHRRVGRGTMNLLSVGVSRIRERMGETYPIIASGGIHQPTDAKEILDAGASLVQVDTGLIFSGPGLPKRINEAILSTLPAMEAETNTRQAKQSWFWTAAMGLGMLIGSVMALWIALTRVVLPYDEAFCGITRAKLEQINDRVLPFMTHDRVTLAGTMVAIGLLYLSFSWFGSRRGEHWAKVAVLASAAVGFFSFFLFLGFDYFDPFHGFVTAVLFQLFVQGIVGDLPSRNTIPSPEWQETKEWRLGQWGQLLLVIHSVGLVGAGVVICGVGIGDVLVRADLKYLQTDLGILQASNARVIPLIAHDRATLGGMLVASGVIYLLGTLWGLRRGSAWLWYAFLWSGLAAYTCAIGVHFLVGYHDWEHLLPAFAGLVLLLAGLGFCRGWILAPITQFDGKVRGPE